MAGGRASRGRPPGPRSQHFLRSDALARELARDAQVGPRDVVVDLGAGTGLLTGALSEVAARVVAVEIDERLVRGLRGRWSNVEVVHADATGAPLPEEPFRVVANLPFHLTTGLLRRLLDDPALPLVRADVIVEWAVAVKRALPWPSTMNSVAWGAFHEAALARRLPRTAFRPAPTVDAGVLVYRRRTVPLVDPDDASNYRGFLARGFRHGPRAVASADTLRELGPRVQARDLDSHQWAHLYRSHS